MIYLSAGLYAEGASDYRFLRPLLDRLLNELAARHFPADYEIAETLRIDTRVARGTRRADRIAAATAEYADTCTIFVIHSDGTGNPDGARETQIDPGIAAARVTFPDVVAVGCIPVREIEAWLLTDRDAFQALLGGASDPRLPADPEKEPDPKGTLRQTCKDGRLRAGPESIHAFFGERVRLATLRALPAFRVFETDLVAAIQQVARLQGHST